MTNPGHTAHSRTIVPANDSIRLVPLANSLPDLAPEPDGLQGTEPIGLANAYSIASDAEWVEVPYRDVPYKLDGVEGIQRLNKAVTQRIVELFNSWKAQLGAAFGGLPFYKGHPDHPYFRARGDTDDNAYGWILDMAAGETGHRLKIDWPPAGAALLANKHFKWFSPYYRGVLAGRENGANIFVPVWLRSGGLTNAPRWPDLAPLVNANPDGTDPVAAEGGKGMSLLDRLKALLGNEEVQTEDDVVSAVQHLISAAQKIREAVQARWAADDAARQALANDIGDADLAIAFIEHQAGLVSAETGRTEALVNEKAGLESKVTDLDGQLVEARSACQAERRERFVLLANAAVQDGRVIQAMHGDKVEELVNADDVDAAIAQLAALPRVVKSGPTRYFWFAASLGHARCRALFRSTLERNTRTDTTSLRYRRER